MKLTGQTSTNLGTMRHEADEHDRHVTLDVTDVGDRADVTIRATSQDVYGLTAFEVEVSISLERPADVRDCAAHLRAIADRLDTQRAADAASGRKSGVGR
jgi:hypothetical protein